MHPSAQRWSDMAKQPNTGLADDLNAEGSAKDGLSVDDLNAGDNTQVKQPLSKTDDAESSVDDDGGDEKSEDTESQEYVVLKGNCIRHDGEMYLAVRSAFLSTMNERASGLSELLQVTTAQPLPALTLANRLYQDATRADELVQEARVPHPAFMPTTMKVLRQ